MRRRVQLSFEPMLTYPLLDVSSGNYIGPGEMPEIPAELWRALALLQRRSEKASFESPTYDSAVDSPEEHAGITEEALNLERRLRELLSQYGVVVVPMGAATGRRRLRR